MDEQMVTSRRIDIVVVERSRFHLLDWLPTVFLGNVVIDVPTWREDWFEWPLAIPHRLFIIFLIEAKSKATYPRCESQISYAIVDASAAPLQPAIHFSRIAFVFHWSADVV